jgi:PmbA protein
MQWWVVLEILDKILKTGKDLGAEVEVYLVEGRSVSAELKREVVSKSIESHHFGLSIRIVMDGCIGISSTSNPADWKKCLEASVASTKLATPQVWNGMPDPTPITGPHLSFDSSLKPEPAIIKKILGSMLEGASRHPVSVTSGGATISLDTITLANSHGIRYSRPHSQVSVSLETIRETSTGYEFNSSCSLDFDPATIGDRAGFLAAASVNGKDIVTGNYDVILSPLAFAQLLSAVLVPALSGRNVHAGRSRLVDSLGMPVTDHGISISDEPLRKGGLGSTRWDAEGTPTRLLPFIRDGILESFAYDLKTAYRHGTKSTGSAVRSGASGLPAIGHHNLVIEGLSTNLMDESALLVQDVVGAHTANPLSGDFSVELTNPFMVSGGTYEFPVRKAMMSGNVFEMLREIAGLGNDQRIVGSMLIPSIKLKKQQIIGI